MTLKTRIWRLLGRTLIRFNLMFVLELVYRTVIREYRPGSSASGGSRYTILALNVTRFRGDLDLLVESGDFRVLYMPFAWQYRLPALFWPDGLDAAAYIRGDDAYRAEIDRSYRFMRRFLPRLLEHFGVDCMVTAKTHYLHDMDWVRPAREIGIPYVALQRENTFPVAPAMTDEYAKRLTGWTFPGDHIVVHSQCARECYISFGFVEPDSISALGCMRMDDFVRRARQASGGSRKTERPQAVLFSFPRGGAMVGKVQPNFPADKNEGLPKLFATVHGEFLRLAKEHPEYEFVIKPKLGGVWTESIKQVGWDYGIDTDALPNLTISHDADVHDLILQSRVVVGFQTTCLLEAALTDAKLVVPFFFEAAAEENWPWIRFREQYHLFDVADDGDDLKAMILTGLRKPAVIGDDLRAARNKMFETYVSSVDGGTVAKYVELLKGYCHKYRVAQGRGAPR